MTFHRRHLGVAARSAVVAVLATSIVLLSPAAAHADGIAWDTPPTTIEYGEFWSAAAHTTAPYYEYSCSQPCPYPPDVTFTGPSSGSFKAYFNQGAISFNSAVVAADPLPAGNYQFTTVYTPVNSAPIVSTDAPFRLTVLAAALMTDLRVTSDPANPGGAIVSAALSGRFVEEYRVGGPALPDGTWTVEATDRDGEVLFTGSRSQANSVAAGANFYWNDVPADETFIVTGTFTPATGPANFSITPGETSFTSPKAPTAPTAPPADDEVAPDTSLASVPVWVLILGALLFLGSAAAATILLVRDMRARRTPTPAEVSPSPENEPETDPELELSDAR